VNFKRERIASTLPRPLSKRHGSRGKVIADRKGEETASGGACGSYLEILSKEGQERALPGRPFFILILQDAFR
jgi:hypothetical protein